MKNVVFYVKFILLHLFLYYTYGVKIDVLFNVEVLANVFDFLVHNRFHDMVQKL
jgi:hypothetical protein